LRSAAGREEVSEGGMGRDFDPFEGFTWGDMHARDDAALLNPIAEHGAFGRSVDIALLVTDHVFLGW
jgi:hypothetical protein